VKTIETASIPVIKLLVDPKRCGPCGAPQPSSTAPRAGGGGGGGGGGNEEGGDDEDGSGGEASAERAAAWAAQAAADDALVAVGGDWGGACVADGLLAVDVSFAGSDHAGIASSYFVRDLVERRFPEAVPLTLVLKELLVQRHLNEPFSGGLSSYAVLLMAVAVLQMCRAPALPQDLGGSSPDDGGADGGPDGLRAGAAHASASPGAGDAPAAAGGRWDAARAFATWKGHSPRGVSMGALLTRFLSFFGREWDIRRFGLSIARSPPGPFALPPELVRSGPDVSIGSVSPVVEDPLTLKNVTRSAFRFEAAVQWLFSTQLTELKTQGVALLGKHRAATPDGAAQQRPNVLKTIVVRY
jgi:hypothetical protein